MDAGLRALGFGTYTEYVASPGWRRRRRAAFRSGRCLACGATRKLVAHHITYLNIGRETQKDLVLLCDGCHSETHRLIQKGVDMAIAHDLVGAKRADRGNRTVVLPPSPRDIPRRKVKKRRVAKAPPVRQPSAKLLRLAEENERLHRRQAEARRRRERRRNG